MHMAVPSFRQVLLSLHEIMEAHKILITGASGFIGRHVKAALAERGYELLCLGRNEADDVRADLSAEMPSGAADAIRKFAPDSVLHFAGVAHGPISDASVFNKVNYDGTRRLCALLEAAGLPQSLVFTSSIAVYGADEGFLIDEVHPLEGHTAYAMSKIAAETFLADWGARTGVDVVVLRLPLVFGADAPGTLGMMRRAMKCGIYFGIGDGKAQRSVIGVDELPDVILGSIGRRGAYNAASKKSPTIEQIEAMMAGALGLKPPRRLPLWLARIGARLGDVLRLPFNSAALQKMTSTLTFSAERFRKDITL